MRAILAGVMMTAALLSAAPAMAGESLGTTKKKLVRMCDQISYRINTMADHTDTSCKIVYAGNQRFNVMVYTPLTMVHDQKVRENWLDNVVAAVGMYTRSAGLQHFDTLGIFDRFAADNGKMYRMPVSTASALQVSVTEGAISFGDYERGIAANIDMIGLR